MKPQHLKDSLVPGWADEVGRQLQGVVNLMAKGAVPADLRPWLCGATLSALPKPTGDHRPVAAGETLRRVAAKARTMASAPEVAAYLEPV